MKYYMKTTSFMKKAWKSRYFDMFPWKRKKTFLCPKYELFVKLICFVDTLGFKKITILNSNILIFNNKNRS